MTGVIVFAVRESEQRREAERARDDLSVVADFQADMIAGVDPEDAGRKLVGELVRRVGSAERARGATEAEAAARAAAVERSLRKVNATDLARWILEENVLRPADRTIASSLAARPRVEGRLRESLGETYARIGLYDEAEPQLERAVEVAGRERGRDDPDTLRARERLAALYDQPRPPGRRRAIAPGSS